MQIRTLAIAACLSFLFPPVNGDAKSLFFEPGVVITKFSVTMMVPAVSRGTSGAHGVWPGIQNDASDYVFQTVVSDSKGAGSWQFFVEYCCNPDYKAQSYKVSPGDLITSTFSSNGGNQWTDNWSISGSTSASGSTGNTYSGSSIINKAVLAIENQNGATWDFGTVVWTSVSITATTTKNWCNQHRDNGGFTTSISNPSSSTTGSSTTCTYQRVAFG